MSCMARSDSRLAVRLIVANTKNECVSVSSAATQVLNILSCAVHMEANRAVSLV